jgi:hypothetical protein
MIFSTHRSAHEYAMEQAWQVISGMLSRTIDIRKVCSFVRKRSLRMLEMDSASFNHFFLEILREEFPQSRFIFVIRDCFSWVDSLANMLLDPNREFLEPAPAILGTPFPIPGGDSPERKELRQNFVSYIDGFLKNWSSHNQRIVEQLPPERSLILRTHELSQSRDVLSDFLAIPPDTLNMSRSHEFRASIKYNVLGQADPTLLESRFNEICSPLMNTFFPGYRLIDFLEGKRPKTPSHKTGVTGSHEPPDADLSASAP